MASSVNVAAAGSNTQDVFLPKSTPDSTVAVRIARTVAEIEEFRGMWTSWKGHRDSSIDFYLEFVGSHEEVVRPHVIVLYRAGQPDAMLIGRLEHRRIAYKIGEVRLLAVPARVLSFMYGGLRGNGSNENCRELIRSIMNSLACGEADMAFLHQVQAGSPIYTYASELPGFACRDHVAQPAAHHFVNLPQSSDQVYASLSRLQRKDLRRTARKLLDEFNNRVMVRCFVGSAELESAIRDVDRVAKRTYQRGLGFGFEDTPRMRQLLRLYAQKGWLRIYVLYAAETPCAFSVGCVSDGVYCGDFLGFDPRFAKYSPGNFLLVGVFEDLCKAGLKAVDFGPGGGAYKERFGNQQLMETSVHIFAPTAKAFVLNALYSISTLADRTVKKMLERTGLLSKIKNIWRRRATPVAAQTGDLQIIISNPSSPEAPQREVEDSSG